MKGILSAILFSFIAFGQPYLESNPIERIDINGDGNIDFVYEFSQEQGGTDPERWSVAFGISPFDTGRFLKFSNTRVEFNSGEMVSRDSAIYSTAINIQGQPPSVFYNLGLMAYESAFYGYWSNWVSPDVVYAGKTNLFFGTRMIGDDGIHYGWLRLVRTDGGPRTPFAVDSFKVHPVPGQPIRAGEAPDVPAPSIGVQENQISLTWDPRWGALEVEYTTNLVNGMWKNLEGTFIGGATLDLVGESTFVRLQWP